MSDSDRQKWNRKYAGKSALTDAVPDNFLAEALVRLSEHEIADQSGPPRAIDLACGLGHNSIWLQHQGWQVDGIDISAAGLQLARECGDDQSSSTTSSPNWIEADLDNWQPSASEYDLAVVFRFLDRDSIPRIIHQSLKPGGWLVFETFSRAQLNRSDSHISNPDFTLASDELPRLFPEFECVIHRVDELSDRTVVRYLGRRRTSFDSSSDEPASICGQSFH